MKILLVSDREDTPPLFLQNFVCVENAKFGKPATVKPGESWTATANFSVVDV